MLLPKCVCLRGSASDPAGGLPAPPTGKRWGPPFQRAPQNCGPQGHETPRSATDNVRYIYTVLGVLDIVISSQKELVDNVEIKEQLGSSDHNQMQFNINIKSDKTKVKQCRRDFRKGNYKEIRKSLALIDWNDKMKNKTATECWNILRGELFLFIYYLLCHIYPGVPHQCATLFSLGLLHYIHDNTNINQYTFSSNTVITWYMYMLTTYSYTCFSLNIMMVTWAWCRFIEMLTTYNY